MEKIREYEILDRISDAFFSVDNNWKFTYFNKQAEILLRRTQEEVIGRNVWTVFPEAMELPFYKNYHLAVMEQKMVDFDCYFPPLQAWYHVRAYPSTNGLSVFFQDITQQKRVSKRREQHYQSLFENNPDAVFSFDLEGNYLSVNPAMEKLLGYSEEEFLQMSFIPLVIGDELKKTHESFSKAAQGITQHYETRAIHKLGHVIDVKVTNMPIIVEGKIEGVYGIAKDITKAKKTEKLLFESEKLTAVGQLAASIAHEIRNPLTSLKGFLQLINSTKSEFKDEYLEIMSDEITRIEMITSELLFLAKPQAHEFVDCHIEKMIEDVVMLLSSQALMHNVEVKVDLEPLPKITCVENQLKQVLINLIKNAVEAMPHGGEVHVLAKKYTDELIKLQVKDQGCGIPEEFLEKLGSPFYTTKEKGTGLGLTTTLRIVQSHQGTMDVTSKQDEGTSIDIYLPINIKKEHQNSDPVVFTPTKLEA